MGMRPSPGRGAPPPLPSGGSGFCKNSALSRAGFPAKARRSPPPPPPRHGRSIAADRHELARGIGRPASPPLALDSALSMPGVGGRYRRGWTGFSVLPRPLWLPRQLSSRPRSWIRRAQPLSRPRTIEKSRYGHSSHSPEIVQGLTIVHQVLPTSYLSFLLRGEELQITPPLRFVQRPPHCVEWCSRGGRRLEPAERCRVRRLRKARSSPRAPKDCRLGEPRALQGSHGMVRSPVHGRLPAAGAIRGLPAEWVAVDEEAATRRVRGCG